MQIRDKKKPSFKFDDSLEYNCIYHLEKFHRGKKNAITHKLLATRINTSHRKVRALVSHLVVEHGIPIGSLSDSGIFYIRTQQEMEQTKAELVSRIEKLAERANAVKENYYRACKNRPKLFEQ